MADYAKVIWDYLKKQYINDFGCAGIIGNLYAESGLNPLNLQDTYEKKIGMTNEQYTKAVDKGTYTNFVKDGAGYGLAQWTYWSRKEGLYNLAKTQNKSIGNIDVQLAYLYAELKSIKWFDSSVKNATSIATASDFILLNFERPLDTSEAMKKKRREYATKYYNQFAAAGSSNSQSSSQDPTTSVPANTYKEVMIGHASIDENGKSSGGAAGDQTGSEVCIRTWYRSGTGWDTVLRPKSSALAEKMASICEWLCTCNLVGYDQSQRNTLYNELEKLNWNYKKLTTKCETDCSALMGTCAKAAGSNVQRCYGNCCYTGNQEELFLKSGDFISLKDSKYLSTSNYLKRGDVLLRTSGHTAMVLSDGPYATTSTTPGVSQNVPKNNPYVAPLFAVKLKSKGIGVKWVQHILYVAGYGTGTYTSFVDGEFGSKTEAAVKRFQMAKGLEVDGVVGKETRAALKKVT